jgi:hypothetical protein
MFCRACGYACPDGAVQCTQCGSPLTPTYYQQPNQNPYQSPPNTSGLPQINTGYNPQGYYGMRPPTYLAQAILVTLFCCLPFGIVAIVYAAQVDSRWASGDIQGAKSASDNAKLWSWIGFGVVAALFVLGIVINIIAEVGGPRRRF